MKPIDVTSDSFAEYNEDSNKKILNLKLVIMLEFLSTKLFLLNDMLLICQKKSLLLIKLRMLFFWSYVINDLNGEEIKGSFYEKELQKTNQHEFRIEKVIKRKGDKLYVKWKGYNNSFNSWINKKEIV